MEAGASILAFVTGGLQSAKLAYDVISGIRDGPQKIRDLESALGRLVQQLAYLETNPSLVPQKDAAIIQKCRDDLDQIRMDIGKLCVSAGDGKLKRFWKKMRPALNEKDIGHILAKVAAQTAAIGVYVVVAQSTTVTEIHAHQSDFQQENKATLDKQSADITEIRARQSDFHKESKATLDKQSADITEIHAHQSTFHQEHKTTLEKQSADISSMASRQIAVHETVTGNTSILMDIASRQTTTQATLVQQEISLAESVTSREEFEDKLFLSLELQQTLLQSGAAGAGAVLEQLSALMPSLAALASHAPTSSSREDAHAHAELLTSIATLRDLVDKEGRLIPSDETGAIKEAVQNILQFLAKELRTYPSSNSWDFEEAHPRNATRILKQLESHFALDNLINFNPTSMHAPSLIAENRMQADSISMNLRLQQADFCIRRRRFTSTSNETCRMPGQSAQQKQQQVGHYDTEIRSDLAIWSHRRGAAGGFVLKASVVEALNNLTGARIALAPMVAVYRTVLSNSEVFLSIRKGRLDKLVGLISEGKASVRDRDEAGASLLHYACIDGGRPDICKFLLEHGADPDDEASAKDMYKGLVYSSFGTPLALLRYGNYRKDEYDSPAVVCARYLLKHGLEVVSDQLLRHTLKVVTGPNLLQIILSAACLTIDPSRHLINGESLFSLACPPIGATLFATLRLLVEAGASVNGLISHEAPPLVLVLKSLMRDLLCCRYRPLGNDAVKTIKYLIDKGADVNATWEGRSCTAIAYGMDGDTSSYIGDVWDAALAATGHDVEEFRRRERRPHSSRFWANLHRPRRDEHRTSYTLTQFRDIWVGMEDRCPYYDQVMSAGEGRVTIFGQDCGSNWCRGLTSRVEGLEDSSSEWETESEGGCDSDCSTD